MLLSMLHSDDDREESPEVGMNKETARICKVYMSHKEGVPFTTKQPPHQTKKKLRRRRLETDRKTYIITRRC